MADASFGFVAHPLPVRLDICCEPLRSTPRRQLGVDVRVHRCLASEAGRNFQHRFLNQHRNRIQIPRQCSQTKPLRFQRDRTTTTKRIQHRRRTIRERLVDLCFRLGQHHRVVGVLPHHQTTQNPKQALTFRLDLDIAQRRITRRIINQRRPHHSTRRRQRTPRPPPVDSAREGGPNRLLLCRLC